MTDTELKRRKAICEAAHVDEIDDVSDGFHTFRQLYYQRMMLFAAIVKQNKDKAWKSLRHEDGELCFGGGWFIVGIDTPEGSYTYHYENNYFSLFDCEELERGKHWDGHTEKDVTRLLSLSPAQPEPCEDAVSREAVSSWLKQYGQDVLHGKYKFSLMYIWKNLMDLPSAQPVQWIPCSERLPDKSGTYICNCVESDINHVTFIKWQSRYKRWDLNGRRTFWRVTAWKPIPEPYERRQE